MRAWNKKIAVALNKGFFKTLPRLEKVKPAAADIAWFVYDLQHSRTQNCYTLVRHQTVYTKFNESLDRITREEHASRADDGIAHRVRSKLDAVMDEGNIWACDRGGHPANGGVAEEIP